jgi:uncharacterized protein involved in cysteine biosynthesis
LRSKGQAGITPFMVIAGLLLLGLSFVAFSLMSSPLKTVIDTTAASTDDGAVKFFIYIIPFFIVLMLAGYGVYIITSGGGDL